jgi:hypothetical protein
MEGLKKRALVAVAVLLVAGTAIAFSKRSSGDKKTEEWMLDHVPMTFGKYTAQSSAENPKYSYKMDEVTYKTLQPYGIVARVFVHEDTKEEYDAVVIASESKDSFHDPRVCFSAQGWSLSNQWIEVVDTKTRGKVPVTLVVMDGAERNRVAAFLYKGPGNKFYGNTQRLKVAMFFEQMKGGKHIEGVFYRFIPTNLDPNDKDQTTKVKRFIAEFVDAVNETSGGYF